MASERISNAELLDYLAGRLDAPARARLERRAAQQPEIRRRLEEARQTWDALAAWQVDVSGMDVRAEVARRAMKPTPNFLLRVDWRQAGRIAATWLLAMALGAAAGRGVAARRNAPDYSAGTNHVELAPTPSEQEVASVLQLDVLSEVQDPDAIQGVLEGTGLTTEGAGG